MLKVMITGCCGYIGSKLTSLMLSHNHYVTGIDSLIYNQKHILGTWLGHPKFNFIHSDVRDTEKFYKIANEHNVVMWLAALVGAPLCDRKTPHEVWSVNYHAVKDFIDKLEDNVRILFPNTNSGYGIGNQDMCDENSPLNPLSLYAKSKCEAEKIILDHENSVSLRLATVFGISPRMRFDLLVNDLVWKAHFSGKLELFEPYFRRNFVGINDVCRAFSWMITPHFNGIYNLGLDEANTTKIGLANEIQKYIPCQITINENKTDPDKRDYLVNNTKIKSTGFKFNQSLSSGIIDIVNYAKILTEEEVNKMGNLCQR